MPKKSVGAKSVGDVISYPKEDFEELFSVLKGAKKPSIQTLISLGAIVVWAGSLFSKQVPVMESGGPDDDAPFTKEQAIEFCAPKMEAPEEISGVEGIDPKVLKKFLGFILEWGAKLLPLVLFKKDEEPSEES